MDMDYYRTMFCGAESVLFPMASAHRKTRGIKLLKPLLMKKLAMPNWTTVIDPSARELQDYQE